MKERRKKDFLGLIIFKGFFLIFLLFGINAFIAFGIFSSANEDTSKILVSWAILDISLILILFKTNIIRIKEILFSLLFIVILILAYFIPIIPNLSQEAMDLNLNISSQYDNKYDYAEQLFYTLEKKWTSPTREYLIQPHKVFIVKSPAYFWEIEGYVPSNIQAQIYRKMLLMSGRFTPNEVTFHHGSCTNSPHGYITIHHYEKGEIWVDFWAIDQFLEYKFGMRAFFPCDKLIGQAFR